ncbi:MAG: NUDIX hydrolase [Actinomycetota bacterium]
MSADVHHTVGAFAVVFDSIDRVLVSHRRDLDLWNLPGGRVQVDELPDAAVVREVKEETGLDVEAIRLTGVYGRNDGQADIVFTFECQVVGGKLVATDEADRHEWFEVDHLPVNTIPKQVARIRDAARREPEPIFRTLTEPSGRRWLEILEEGEAKR